MGKRSWSSLHWASSGVAEGGERSRSSQDLMESCRMEGKPKEETRSGCGIHYGLSHIFRSDSVPLSTEDCDMYLANNTWGIPQLLLLWGE